MPDRFHEIRDDIEYALAGALAHLDEIAGNLGELFELLEDLTELEKVRAQLEPAAGAIEDVATRFGRLSPDGTLSPA